MNYRTISSGLTFVIKFVMPIVWISLFGLTTLALWFDLMHEKNGELPPHQMKVIFSTVWVLGTIFFMWFSANLKRVRLAGRNLYVSNYIREICVPVDMVAGVTENRWINYHPIAIHFKERTAFGMSVTFVPPKRFLFWQSHPIVAELNKMAGYQNDCFTLRPCLDNPLS